MPPKAPTFLVLDGLQEPRWAAALSRRWADAGWSNQLDVAGQNAVLQSADDTPNVSSPSHVPLSEADVERATAMARDFGVIVHDRVGRRFVADNLLEPLQRHVAVQYRQRFVAALMFGIPVLVLHHAGPYLAGGGSAGMAFPWLFEMLLAGWACVAAGWSVLWNAVRSLIRLRPTADLLTGLLLASSFLTSMHPLGTLVFPSDHDAGLLRPPMFHATVLVLWVSLAQRWLVQRASGHLRGRGSWMLRGHAWLVTAWCGVFFLVASFAGWPLAVGFGILLPPMLSFGAINRRAAGWSAAMPVVGFAFVYLFGPQSLGLQIDGIEIEIAAGFAVIMTIVFVCGWRAMDPVLGPGVQHAASDQ